MSNDNKEKSKDKKYSEKTIERDFGAKDTDKDVPIIFLDDVKVTFKTRTGPILHPNLVHAVRGLTLKLMPGETIGLVG
ncbi:MAG: hypothetical protein LUB61_02640, partial [Eggerthellaceae bacterium]|nr:hypothetical protein [Eggerthellaceae bacterium]